MWITQAFAQEGTVATPAPDATAATGASAAFSSLLIPMILIFGIMYFLLIRPQQRKVKAHQELVRAVRRGDTIVTNGGMVGKVTKVVDETEVEVEIAEKTRVRMLRAAIAEVRTKGEPAKEEASAA